MLVTGRAQRGFEEGGDLVFVVGIEVEGGQKRTGLSLEHLEGAF